MPLDLDVIHSAKLRFQQRNSNEANPYLPMFCEQQQCYQVRAHQSCRHWRLWKITRKRKIDTRSSNIPCGQAEALTVDNMAGQALDDKPPFFRSTVSTTHWTVARALFVLIWTGLPNPRKGDRALKRRVIWTLCLGSCQEVLRPNKILRPWQLQRAEFAMHSLSAWRAGRSPHEQHHSWNAVFSR